MKKVSVVGIGPGHAKGMTYEAREVLERADVHVGYTKYLELISDLYPEKETYSTPMRGEKKRCEEALRLASEGKHVAIVCSGDAGVYGMASLVYQLSLAFEGVEIEVIAGVSAAMSGAALLGAPLSHDFAVISLSDLLTPWETIEKRVEAAAAGDFCISLYNPMSKRRVDQLKKACEIMMKHKSPETLCGITVNIGRESETVRLLTLKELADTKVDMFTTIFIGNRHTQDIRGKMVTPRGYEIG
jgi:precorrin-3B C17-methyltransferase